MKTGFRFWDPVTIDETLTELAILARRDGIKVALLGGTAMAIYGSDRPTTGIDVASVDEYLTALKPVRDLPFGGVVGTTPGGREVKLIVRSDEYRALYVAAVEGAREVGLPLRVVTPEHLVALKMATNREPDLLDVAYLLRADPIVVPARAVVRKYLGEYAARALDSLRDEVMWVTSREQGTYR